VTTAKRTFASLKVPGFALKFEAPPSPLDAERYHPHVHAIVDVPTGGRDFIPSHAWSGTFFEQLPNGLHPERDYFHNGGRLESVIASAQYLTKSPYHAADIADVPRIVESISCLMRASQFVTGGSLTLAP
jgi:hypothetical protein